MSMHVLRCYNRADVVVAVPSLPSSLLLVRIFPASPTTANTPCTAYKVSGTPYHAYEGFVLCIRFLFLGDLVPFSLLIALVVFAAQADLEGLLKEFDETIAEKQEEIEKEQDLLAQMQVRGGGRRLHVLHLRRSSLDAPGEHPIHVCPVIVMHPYYSS